MAKMPMSTFISGTFTCSHSDLSQWGPSSTCPLTFQLLTCLHIQPKVSRGYRKCLVLASYVRPYLVHTHPGALQVEGIVCRRRQNVTDTFVIKINEQGFTANDDESPPSFVPAPLQLSFNNFLDLDKRFPKMFYPVANLQVTAA